MYTSSLVSLAFVCLLYFLANNFKARGFKIISTFKLAQLLSNELIKLLFDLIEKKSRKPWQIKNKNEKKLRKQLKCQHISSFNFFFFSHITRK